MAIHNARRYLGDKLVRVAKPHRMLDPANGPLIAVRLNILTRKSLGGFQTDLDAHVLAPDGQPLAGLYAAGEAAGFGGGGLHGYRALEGSFLGGCLFTPGALPVAPLRPRVHDFASTRSCTSRFMVLGSIGCYVGARLAVHAPVRYIGFGKADVSPLARTWTHGQ